MNYTNKLIEILYPRQDDHVLSLGAHIHRINVFSAQSDQIPDFGVVQYINPAVSPIYNNNPGFGWLEMSDNRVDSLQVNFMQLEDFHRMGIIDF